MYINMNSDKKSEGFMFKIIGIMLAVILIIVGAIAISSAMKKDDTDTDMGTSDTSTPPSTQSDIQKKAPDDSDQIAVLPDTDTSETTDETDNPETTETPSDPDITTSSGDYSDTILGETEDMGQDYLDKIVFFGDSTTYGLKAYKMLSGGRETKQVWTPASGTLSLDKAIMTKIYYPETGQEIKVTEAMAAKKPEILIITLGVNGISYMNEDTFKIYYKNLVDEVKAASPDTKIILQSIYPVSTKWENTDSFDNATIDTANTWILDVAKECGVKYLNTNPSLKDETGFLPLNYQNDGDGMHLDTAGFTAVLNYIKTHAYIN